MTGTKNMSSVDMLHVSVLRKELERLEDLDLVVVHEEAYIWLKQRLRALEGSK